MRRFFSRSVTNRSVNGDEVFAPLNDEEQYSSGSSEASDGEPKEEDSLRGDGLQLSLRSRIRNPRQPHRNKRKGHPMRSEGSGGASRKRHYPPPKGGSLTHSHHTISARQKQMYLITTLLPNQVEPPLINQILPKELLLRIFSYLDIVSLCRCAQTCRFWNILALDGSNWQRVDLFSFQKDVKAPVVENLANRCGNFLKTLSLRGCENVQESALRLFSKQCPNIERLSLYKCKRVTDSTCDYLGRNCHKLVWLDLENCTDITDQALEAISNGCKGLEHLNISWCDKIQDKGVRCILKSCSHLTNLNLKGCDGISENVFADMSECCKELRFLNLHGCFIIDKTVADIASGCRNLEYLCLSSCTQITDRSLTALANNCLLLKDLELAGCAMLTDNGFAPLAKSCHDLERMDMEDCSLITDATLDSLSRGCPCLINLNFTEVFLQDVTPRMLQSLSHCELITDAGLRHLCLNQNLRERLQVLELDNCPLITEVCLDHMKQLRSLQRVDLYDCQNVSKESIKRFKSARQGVEVHVYFTPDPPVVPAQLARNRICRCCAIL